MLIYGHVVSPTSTEAWFLVGPSLLDSGHCEKNDHDQHDENKCSAPPLPPIWIFSQLFKHLLEKMVVFFAGRDDQLKPPRLKLGEGGDRYPFHAQFWMVVFFAVTGLVNSHHVPYILTCSADPHMASQNLHLPQTTEHIPSNEYLKNTKDASQGISRHRFWQAWLQTWTFTRTCAQKSTHRTESRHFVPPAHKNTNNSVLLGASTPPLIGFGGGAGYLYPNYTLSIVA